eukprot:jgi/Mesen1/8889/ME000535S08206
MTSRSPCETTRRSRGWPSTC